VLAILSSLLGLGIPMAVTLAATALLSLYQL
jgi:hypothetical protein